MMKSTGVTYADSRYKCQSAHTCIEFDSLWDAGECYEKGGRLVRECSEADPTEDESEEHADASELERVKVAV